MVLAHLSLNIPGIATYINDEIVLRIYWQIDKGLMTMSTLK